VGSDVSNVFAKLGGNINRLNGKCSEATVDHSERQEVHSTCSCVCGLIGMVNNDVIIHPSGGVENQSPLNTATQSTAPPIIISNVTPRSHGRKPQCHLL